MNSRRFVRFPYNDEIRVSWQDAQGQVKFAKAKCLDISERGIAIELVEPVQVRSYVTLKCDKLRLAGSAAVRYCRRGPSKYLIGLEFCAGLKCTYMPDQIATAV